MTTLREIEAKAKAYADAREALWLKAQRLTNELTRVRDRHLPEIRALAGEETNRRNELAAEVDANRGLFTRPKSRVLHGIKVGLKKGAGGLRWASDETVVKLIRRHMPDRFDQLVKVTEKPLKKPLEQLPAADLKKLGVEIVDAGDEVLVKPADSEIDKLVDALLDDGDGERREVA